MGAPEIRPLDPEMIGEIGELYRLAFGGQDRPLTLATSLTSPEDTVAAVVDGRPVGAVTSHRFRQWFGGRDVPCAGVAGVVVTPDQRGSGLARSMLAAATEAFRAQGDVVSALFPTTAPLYRSVGYEVAGWWARSAIAVTDLPRPTGELTWSPGRRDDPAVAAVVAAGAAGRDGWVVPGDRWWSALAASDDADPTPPWTWLGRRDGRPVAAITYGHAKTDPHRAMYDLDVHLVAGVDGDGLREALAFLGGHGTTVDRVRTTLPPTLLARILPGSSRPSILHDWPWMLRLVDLPGAIEARGWPAGLDLDVDLAIVPPSHAPDDPIAGRWRLRLADGAATCEPGGDGTVEVTATDLAALYSGHLDPAVLVAEGRLSGAEPATVSGLRAALAGSPSLPTFF